MRYATANLPNKALVRECHIALPNTATPPSPRSKWDHKNARMLHAHYRDLVQDAEDITSYRDLLPSRTGEIAKFVA